VDAVAFRALNAVRTPAGLDVIRLPRLQRPGFGANLVLIRRLLCAARGAQAAERASDGVAVAVVGHSVDDGVDGRVRVDQEVRHEPQYAEGFANLKLFQNPFLHLVAKII
jgi:hypothetical protein